MLPQPVGESAQTDGREEVDSEAAVLRGVAREQALHRGRHGGVAEAVVELAPAQGLRHLLAGGGDGGGRE